MSARIAFHLLDSVAIERLPVEERTRRAGDYAVVVGGRVESCHPSNREALDAALARHRYGQFSVQRIGPTGAERGLARGANDTR